MTRREWLLATSGSVAASAQTTRRPNILFLLADDQRFNTIHALGNNEVQTPNLDRLCARGVAFTHAFIQGGSVGAVCMPSRMMLMSGQHLFHASEFMTPNLAANTRPFHMWPEELRKAGYRTWATGKWHNSPKLHARCFNGGKSLFFGGMGEQGALPVWEYSADGNYPKDKAAATTRLSTEVFADNAVAFIKEHKGAEPFAAYVAFTSPHDPRTAPPEYHKKYVPARMEVPASFLPEHPFDNGELKVRDELLAPFPRTHDVVRQHTADYYACITHVDAHVGRILDALDASPHGRNTIVVYGADNGLALGRHGLFGKQNVYDHSVRVPLIVAGPGIPKGERRTQMVHLHDMCPTLLDLAGVPIPSTVESRTLVPILKDAKVAGREEMFAAYRDFQRAVRTKDWKLIRYTVNGSTRLQLFDMANDPEELRDLAGDLRHAGRIAALSARLAVLAKESGDKKA